MHIIVCVKQTPKSENVQIDKATGCLIRTGTQSAMNPFDEYALEEAVLLKEQTGGHVCVITMGPPQAQDVLRDSIARGADEVFLLSGAEFAGADTLATGYALSKGIEKINSQHAADLIICGKQSNDSDTGNVGAQVAAWLGYPYAGEVKKITCVTEKYIEVLCQADEADMHIRLPLPCVISVLKTIACPRVRSVKGRLRAQTAPITTWAGEDIHADKTKLGLAGSPTRVIKSFAPERSEKATFVDGTDACEKARALVARLKEHDLI